MARLDGVAQTAEIALTAATVRTVLQIVAPANHRVAVKGYGVFFDGTSVTAEPVQVEVLYQTTAGTMSANTPRRIDGGLSETLLTTAQDAATVEPAAGDVVDVVEVHPQQGYEKMCVFGYNEIVLGGGDRLGIRCTAPAGVNVRAKFLFEE